MKNIYCLFIVLIVSSFVYSQSYITKSVKSFGAKGDGKTNDHAAFEKAAAFFNARKGHGTLTIPAGTYLVGKQIFTKGAKSKPAYEGSSLLRLDHVSDFTIEGTSSTVIRYIDNLKFGSFNPLTGKAHEHGNNLFVKYDWAAFPAHAIYISESDNVTIYNLQMDGNNSKLQLGGVYGDVGRQLPHTGIFILNSREIKVDKVNIHHFGLDGICVSNIAAVKDDEIKIINSVFEYNARQGLSWVGGNDLKVKDCKFNNTGQGSLFSPPGAGVDIEAEVGPVRNGRFVNCEFMNNKGNGMVADRTNSADCEFTNCTFWGLDSWSIWVASPGFVFRDSKIFGGFVHGYDASTDKEATKFYNCQFEDKPYMGKAAYGTYLVESNEKKKMQFYDCTFTSNNKKLLWVIGHFKNSDDNYRFENCSFVSNNINLPKGDFVANFYGIKYKNSSFKLKGKGAKTKGYFLNNIKEKSNADAGGNSVEIAD